MKITYFGTSTLLFDDGADQILFDAHITRPSLPKVMFGKIASDENLVEKIIEKHEINRLRAIFVSHSHHDHVMDAPAFSRKCNATIYGSESTLNVARGGNVPPKNLMLFHGNEQIELGKYRVTIIPSKHSDAKWYNNDLGKTIHKTVVQPARKAAFKEGGSYDFLIENGGKKYLIRPSFNYIVNQFQEMEVDILFLGIVGICKASEETKSMFFRETIEKVHPKLVIPIHWDDFFSPVDQPVKPLSGSMDNSTQDLFELQSYCEDKDISCCVQLPLTSIQI